MSDLTSAFTTESTRQIFSQKSLDQIVGGGDIGFYPTRGFHIYCELRPTSKLEVAENEAKALKYVRVLEEYVNHGVAAANPFKATLLEVQGNVLHFYKEAAFNLDTAIEAIQFVYLFTNTLYDELKPDLGSEWDGFASCMAHGPSIIVRHESFMNSSSVSLGPSANSPAKRLLYGGTSAGCVEVPSEWRKALGIDAGAGWATITLRDRTRVPHIDRVENQLLRNNLIAAIREYRKDLARPQTKTVSLLENRKLFEGTTFTFTAPQRVKAFCLRADLDGFSAIVEEAFQRGGDAVKKVAMDFAKVIEFGQYMERSTAGSIRLPWAGDCATLLVPSDPNTGGPTIPRWLDVAMRWQSFGGGDQEAVQKGWANLFQRARWSIGACHGHNGMSIVAPVQAQGRTFLLGAGWPVAMSLDAQNLGRGGDIITHDIDCQALDSVTKTLFSHMSNKAFWKTVAISQEKLAKAAIEAAKSKTPQGEDYSAKYRSIQVPASRPHYQ